MKALLKQHGASEEDLSLMESGYIHKKVPQDLQPIMSHRQIAFHRMLLDDISSDISPAATHACTQIPQKDIASSTEEGSTLNFRRYDPSISQSYLIFNHIV